MEQLQATAKAEHEARTQAEARAEAERARAEAEREARTKAEARVEAERARADDLAAQLAEMTRLHQLTISGQPSGTSHRPRGPHLAFPQ